MYTRKIFRRYLLSGLWLLQAVATANAWFSLPPGAGITTVLDSADNQFCWYAGPGDQQEWLINKGAHTAIRIKGNQDVTGLKFNLAAYRGQRVVAAELHLARANTDLVTSLAAATINTDWAENSAGWHWPSKKYRRYGLDADKQEDWIWYGLGAPVSGSGTANARTFLQKWCQGFNGGLPYWDSYNTQWINADDSTPCVVYSGQSVPGFGTYSGPIMSRRVKQMRQAQQIVELLNLWSACRGMNRSRVRNALNATYGQGTWDYAFGTLDEVKLYQLHAGLVAQLEAQSAPLKIARVDSAADSSMVLYWPSLSNCTYTVLRATNLVAGTFQSVGSAMTATPPGNVYTATPALYPAAFYKLLEQGY